MEERMVFEVSQVNLLIKDLLEGIPDLNHIYIRGEISNYKVYPSGHHYFTLKDAEGALRAVMFKGAAMKLRFRPVNGMKVIERDITCKNGYIHKVDGVMMSADNMANIVNNHPMLSTYASLLNRFSAP